MKKQIGRGIIGRAVRVGRSVRIIVAVGADGAIKLDRSIEGLKWWNRDGVKFVRHNYEVRA